VYCLKRTQESSGWAGAIAQKLYQSSRTEAGRSLSETGKAISAQWRSKILLNLDMESIELRLLEKIRQLPPEKATGHFACGKHQKECAIY
jgi:hypothetical protein